MKMLGVCGSLQRQPGNDTLLDVAAASTPVLPPLTPDSQ